MRKKTPTIGTDCSILLGSGPYLYGSHGAGGAEGGATGGTEGDALVTDGGLAAEAAAADVTRPYSTDPPLREPDIKRAFQRVMTHGHTAAGRLDKGGAPALLDGPPLALPESSNVTEPTAPTARPYSARRSRALSGAYAMRTRDPLGLSKT